MVKFTGEGYEEISVLVTGNDSRKRKNTGRMPDVSIKLNIQYHIVGPDSCCKRLKCFETARTTVLKNFNLITSIDEQNTYL